MEQYQGLLDRFIQQNLMFLDHDLVGIYLHGSAAMGCFNPSKSDIDLIVVVRNALSQKTKRRYMDMLLELSQEAPAKGIELSIVQESVCKPFVYPTPYEFHFPLAPLEWYQSNPDEYMARMQGTDKDLAAHFTIIWHRGKTLYGKEIREVFSPVSHEAYLDSLWYDTAEARNDIRKNPVYTILNLCRVLAYVQENLILSKLEGGRWGLLNVSARYGSLISAALEEYQNNITMALDEALAVEYADYMLAQIRKGKATR